MYAFLIAGLIIPPQIPFLASTPDNIIVTSKGEIITVEVKCPVSTDAKSVDWIKDGKFVDNRQGNIYRLQFQMQIWFCRAQRGIMFIYSESNNQIVYDNFDKVFL